jgi:hypothetical protein
VDRNSLATILAVIKKRDNKGVEIRLLRPYLDE